MTEKINLTIDGVEVRVNKGATVLEAAQTAGIYIPMCNAIAAPLEIELCGERYLGPNHPQSESDILIPIQ